MVGRHGSGWQGWPLWDLPSTMGTNDKANRAKHETITVTSAVKKRSGSLGGLTGKRNTGAISKKTGKREAVQGPQVRKGRGSGNGEGRV